MGRKRHSIPNLKFDPKRQRYYVFVDRRRIWLGADRVEAERQRMAFVDGSPRPVPSGGSASVAEVLEVYLRWAMEHYKDARARRRIKTAVLAAAETVGACPANRWGAKLLKQVRDVLLRRRPAYSRRYINHLVTALKTATTWLASEELVPADSLASVRSVRSLEAGMAPDRSPIQYVDADTVARTLPHLGESIAAMVRVQQLTGMRPGEVCRMRRCDISTSPGQTLDCGGRSISAVYVEEVLVWFYCPPRHKNSHRGKLRAIPIGPEAQAVLAPWLMATEPDQYVFRPAGGGCCRPGKCYTVEAYARAIHRAIDRANRRAEVRIDHWQPRQLRKTAAAAIDAACGAGTAGDVLGHSASRRALDFYLGQQLDRAAAAAAAVG